MQEVNVKLKLVVFSLIKDSLAVFLPDNLLPVKVITPKISLDEQVKALFYKSFGFSLEKNYVEQLYTISNDNNEVTIVYYILLSNQSNKLKDSSRWVRYQSVNKDFFDYNVISYAVQRLQWKIEYTNVVYSLLPYEFTLSDLQKTYEAILETSLDKRNFRKKILSLRFLKLTGKKHIGAARPAQTYTFKDRNPTLVKIF